MGCASATLKNINQDFFVATEIPNGEQKLMVIADGIGSFYKAEVASEFVCKFVNDRLMTTKVGEMPNFRCLFDEAQLALRQHIEDVYKLEMADVDTQKAFGTTIISCIETDNIIYLAYLGNGGIYHFRGNFNHFPASSPQNSLPWCAINLLNPHSIWEKGKNAMYKFIAYEKKNYATIPSCISILKDNEYFGDIIVLCTDGVFSYDQVDVGAASDGNIWVSAEETIILLNHYLKLFFYQEEWTNETLTKSLEMYLEDLKGKKLMSDDCTISVLINAQALSFQKKQKNRKENETNK